MTELTYEAIIAEIRKTIAFDEISLSAMDSQQLAEALDAPAEPSEALTKLFKGENK